MSSKPWRVRRFSREHHADLIAVCFLGEIDESHVRQFMADFDVAFDWSARTVHFGLLIDTTVLTRAPSTALGLLRDYMIDHRPHFSAFSLCTCIAVDSSLLRLFLRALFKLQSPARPVDICKDSVRALEVLTRQYGVAMPELIQLEALGVRIDAAPARGAGDDDDDDEVLTGEG